MLRKFLASLSPSLRRRMKALVGLSSSNIRLEGPYSSWSDARAKSTGYDSESVLSRVLEVALSAQDQPGLFERDSILINSGDRSWPVTAALLIAAATSDSRFEVLDFGGSLGSTYFHNHDLLRDFDLRWTVVEQKAFVDAGIRHLETAALKFREEIPVADGGPNPNVVLLSSVIQYLEKPSETLEKLLNLRPEILIVDRTPFSEEKEDSLMVQVVGKPYYEGSYPMWVLSRAKFIASIPRTYELVAAFPGPEGSVFRAGKEIRFEGYIYRRVSSEV